MAVSAGSPITASSLNSFVSAHQDDWKLLFDFTNSTTWSSGTKIYTNKSDSSQPRWEDFIAYNNCPVVIEWSRNESGSPTVRWYSFEKIYISGTDAYFHTEKISKNSGTSSATLLTGVFGLTRGSYNDEGTTVYTVARNSLTCQAITFGTNTVSIANAIGSRAGMAPQRMWLLETPSTDPII